MFRLVVRINSVEANHDIEYPDTVFVEVSDRANEEDVKNAIRYDVESQSKAKDIDDDVEIVITDIDYDIVIRKHWTIYEMVVRYIRAKDMSVSEFARISGISRQTIYLMRKGHKVGLALLKEICNTIGKDYRLFI